VRGAGGQLTEQDGHAGHRPAGGHRLDERPPGRAERGGDAGDQHRVVDVADDAAGGAGRGQVDRGGGRPAARGEHGGHLPAVAQQLGRHVEGDVEQSVVVAAR
jgi:hypothetical protein